MLNLILIILIIILSIVSFMVIKSYKHMYQNVKQGGNENIIEGMEFPYRKHMLEPYVQHKLNILFNSTPNIKQEIWSFQKIKLKQLTDYKFALTNIVAYPSIKNHWDAADNVIDYYSEKPRIQTPGYGELYSLYEYWYNPNLHHRWLSKLSEEDRNLAKNNNQIFREALYSSIQEPRVAYTSVNISLYKIFNDILKDDGTLKMSPIHNIKVCDIAAYGERAIACSKLCMEYHGIDINTDLVLGLTKLKMDLYLIDKWSNIHFYFVGMENFKTNLKFDIITYSPPPFNTEPYSGNKKLQSYNKYPTFEEYFGRFLVELIYKAKKIINNGGLFSFTALDRDSTVFKHKYEKHKSKHLDLIYVEALLLVTNAFGFKYYGAIGLSVGDKPAQVPWWTFLYIQDQYSLKASKECYNLLKTNYSKLFNIFGMRLANSILRQDKSSDIIEIVKTKHEKLSSVFEITQVKELVNNNFEYKLIDEMLRHIIQNYIVTMIVYETKIRFDKVKTYLGRYLMTRSINSTFEKPWLSGLYMDPVFPVITESYNIEDIENQLIEYFNSHQVDGQYIVKSKNYWLGSYECIGISELYDTAANYMVSYPRSNLKVKHHHIEKTNTWKFIISGFNDVIGYIKDYYIISHFNNNVLSNIRYETLGALTHQYTRTNKRIEILEKIVKQPLIDIYASELNNNSEYYCSIYPDVENNSVGSAFSLNMISGAYMANPVDVPVFVTKAMKNILNNLQVANENDKKLIISMSFVIWLDTNEGFVEKIEVTSDVRNLLSEVDNKAVSELSKSQFIEVVYILNSNNFPSVTHDKKVLPSNNRGAISLGIILSSKKGCLNKDHIIELTKNKQYYILD